METQLSTPTAKVDIIIVGAGISGLTTAVKILQKEQSLQVKILEATSVIGGQIGETSLGEIGAKWITDDQYHIYRLLEQLEIPTRRRMLVAPMLKRCWDIDRGMFSRLAKYELERYIRELELRVHYYQPGCYDPCKRSKSMYRHICNRLFFDKSRQFMMSMVQLICGVDARYITYVEFMSICCTCGGDGGLKKLIDLYLEWPNTLLEFSSRKLLQIYLEKLKFTEILCERKVYEIRHFKDHVEVCDELQIHTADAVILAIPWNNIQDLNIVPHMPLELLKPSHPLQRRPQMVTSFIAKYNDGHWRTAGYSGDLFSTEPLIVGHEYRPTTYTGITVHDEAIDPVVVRSFTLQTLALSFGPEMLLPIEFGQHTYELSSLANVPFTTPWNRVIWSSSAAAATIYRGRLGGAVQSGLRAALNALLIVRPQTVSWQDIAEIQLIHFPKRKNSWLTLWLSTWNLYNVTYYSLYFAGLVFALRKFYKINSLHS